MAQQKHGIANPGYIEAMRGLRSSSAAQPHVLKKNKGTRGAQTRKVLKEHGHDQKTFALDHAVSM